MVYVFDPTTCEEPKKPTYRYSPIPKAVECSCCPVYEEEGTGGTEGGGTSTGNPPFLLIPDGPSTEEPKPITPVRGAEATSSSLEGDDLILHLDIYGFNKGYLKAEDGSIYEISADPDGTASVNIGDYTKYFDMPPFTVYAYNDDGTASEVTTITEYLSIFI